MDIEKYLSDPRTAYIAKEYKKNKEELHSLSFLVQDGMDELVQEEKVRIKKQMDEYMKQMEDITREESEPEEYPNEVLLEVRAGAGGDEASIFARDLAHMYEQYAEAQDIRFSTVHISKNNLGGYKEAAFQIKGKDIYKNLQFETGVHRVQRVPVTEKSGRVHTSTASVAVLPIQKKANVELLEKDLKMEFSRSGGAGGQNVNKVESAVRLLHIPTGLEVRCTEERTQLKNREKALSILAAKVAQHIREKEDKEYATMRRTQIGTGDRSEKIRTYNIMQDRVTDHRIKKSWSGVESILGGQIDTLIKDTQEAQEKMRDESGE